MKLFLSLLLLTTLALETPALSEHTQSPRSRQFKNHHHRSTIGSGSSSFAGELEHSYAWETPSGLSIKPHTLVSRDASSCESNVPQPLLIGVVLGIFGTLFIQGFVLLFFRIYHRSRQESAKIGLNSPQQPHLHPFYPGQIPIPSSPMDFRHIEHIAMSHHTPSPAGSTASLLRVAHRQPDGSWAFTDSPAVTPNGSHHSDTRSEISSISPFATPLTPLSPMSHRFPPSPRGVPSVPHSVAPRHSMETITTNHGGYEKSVYSSSAMTHSPLPSISRSTHTSTSMSMSMSAMNHPSPKQHQFHIQNLPPSSPPPPMPLPPLPPTPSRSDRGDPETQTLLSTQTQSGSSRRLIDEEVGSTRTGPPPYAAYIPTWREQQQMQNMPPLPSGSMMPSSPSKGGR